MDILHKPNKLTRLLPLAIFIFFTIFVSGCSNGTFIEEEQSDPRLTGKIIHFNESMIYMILSKKDAKDWDRKAAKIGREIISRSDFEAPYSIFSKYPKEDIRVDMTFTIISSYWVRGDRHVREYAPDAHMVILKDENNTLSACSIREIKEIETNILGELQ